MSKSWLSKLFLALWEREKLVEQRHGKKPFLQKGRAIPEERRAWAAVVTLEEMLTTNLG